MAAVQPMVPRLSSVALATEVDPTVEYTYSRASVGLVAGGFSRGPTPLSNADPAILRGLAPEHGSSADRLAGSVPQDAKTLQRERAEERRARSRRAAGGGFQMPYRRPASGMRRRSAAEPINDTGGFATSLRPPRPSSAAMATIALNRPLAEETGARIGGSESYWGPSQRRLRITGPAAQTAQELAAANAARKGGRMDVTLNPSLFSVGPVSSAASLARRPRSAAAAGRTRRRRPVSASSSAGNLRTKQVQAAAAPWQKVTYRAGRDPAGLLATPVSETVSGYSLGGSGGRAVVGTERPPPAAAVVSWGRLLRGWHAMCDTGPSLRAVGLAPPPPRTPALELALRTTQQLDEAHDVGAGRRFALAAALQRLVLARAVLGSEKPRLSSTAPSLLSRKRTRNPHRSVMDDDGQLPLCSQDPSGG